MKLMFLTILLSTLLFSYEKQIVLGNYENSDNSLNAVKRLTWLSNSDAELKELIKKNSLEIVSKKIGEYEVVTLQPFYSYVQLLRTLKALDKYYEGLYVLDYSLKEEIVVKKDIPAEIKTIVPEK